MPIDDRIAKQAAYWFATLHDENRSVDDEQEFQQWLASDSRHREAWHKLSNFSQALSVLDRDATKHALTFSASTKNDKLPRNVLMSCALLLGVVATVYVNQPPSGLLQTQIGETKEFQLPDETQLWLNTDTRVQVNYHQNVREIRLEHGEIWLRTGHDKTIPYQDLVVETADGQLKALGTKFSVHYQPDFTVLNVFEGAVEITPADISASKSIVPAGQQGRFDDTQVLEQGLHAEPASSAWVQGVLLANDQPLCDFIEQLNRYRQQAIQCSASLNHYHLVGAYPLQNLANILVAIETSLPVHIHRNEHGLWQVSENR